MRNKSSIRASSIFTIQDPTIQLHITIYNNGIFLVLPTSVSSKKLVFLIDTGSQISIIKAEEILDARIDTKRAIEIIGIANDKTIQSLGVTKALLTCNDSIFAHDFHVMHENVFLRPDGILGADFLIKFNAKIDMAAANIQLRLPPTQSGIKENTSKFVSSSQIRFSI